MGFSLVCCRLLKSEMSSEMRKAAMRTIGILGAIDPYTHKVYTGAVPSADKITTALSLPIVKVVSDSRQGKYFLSNRKY